MRLRLLLYVAIVTLLQVRIEANDLTPSCPQPPTLINGHFRPLKTDFPYGSVVFYKCDPGYRLEGSRKLGCIAAGKWDGKTPRCLQEKDNGKSTCRISETPANGRVFPSLGITVNIGKRVMYKCRRGYKLIGNSQTICGAGNRLREPVPHCKRVSGGCTIPTSIKFGKLSPNSGKLRYGEKVRARCNRGYVLKGSMENTCLYNGSISNRPPRCTRVSSQRLSAARSLNFGQSENPLLQRRSQVLCRLPSRSIKNGIVISPVDSVREGDIISYKCDKGYAIEGSDTSTCFKSGNFWPRPPVCVRKNRKSPRKAICNLYAFFNGRMTTSRKNANFLKVGEVARFSCNAGYKLMGYKKTICGREGKLLPGGAPHCVRYCAAPRTEENGIVYGIENGIVFAGKRVFFDCKVGYKLIGWDHTVCRSNGTYEHEPPLCVRYCCKKPVISVFGRMIENHEYYVKGEMVIFKCVEGYELVGSYASVCHTSGQFVPNPPVCRRIGAQHVIPTSCEIGKIDPAVKIEPDRKVFAIGSLAAFSCEATSELHGPNTAVCELDGRFHVTLPKCLAIRKKCSLPKLEEDVTVDPSHTEYDPGAVVKFSCGKNFLKIDGPVSGKCRDNGEFDIKRMPRCALSWSLLALLG